LSAGDSAGAAGSVAFFGLVRSIFAALSAHAPGIAFSRYQERQPRLFAFCSSSLKHRAVDGGRALALRAQLERAPHLRGRVAPAASLQLPVLAELHFLQHRVDCHWLAPHAAIMRGGGREVSLKDSEPSRLS
jgi:hypothetical protein